MPPRDDHVGLAALSICEQLMLAMKDQELPPEAEIVGVLEDAAETHANASGSEAEERTHRAVAKLINRISAGGNSLRRPQD